MAYCENYIDLISAGLDGALSPAEQKELEAHLAECPECRALRDDLAALRDGLARLPAMKPPADLTQRIMKAIPTEKVVPFPGGRSPQWKKWVASAAVFALVIAGAWSWRSGPSGQTGELMPMAATPPTTQEPAWPESAVPLQTEAPRSDGGSIQAKAATGGQAPELTPSSDENEAAVPRSAAPVQPQTRSVPVAPAADSLPEETTPQVTPRLFCALPPAEAGAAPGQSAETGATSDQSAESQPDLTSKALPPSDTAPAPNAVVLASAPIPAQLLTAQEAVQALANYIYEFVEQVEPMALEEPGAQVWLLSSPTGISGTAALDEETDQLFRFTYRDEEGGESLCYTVDKTDGKVLFLEQEPSN